MGDAVHDELYRRTQQLLEPGEIELAGAIVHTGRGSDAEPGMHQDTIEIGELIAAAAGQDDTYVYSGTDDPEFASNQHQGLTLEDDAFVWECQQLLREGTFDLVFYYEAEAHEEAVAAIEDAGYDVAGVTV
jgi:hypothetical protein